MKSMKEIAEEQIIDIEQNNGETQITEVLIYDDIIRILQEAKENEQPIDEGIFKAIFGGLAGATAGPAIMKGICKVLGIDERGPMGSLMTSRLILTGLGAYLGWRN